MSNEVGMTVGLDSAIPKRARETLTDVGAFLST